MGRNLIIYVDLDYIEKHGCANISINSPIFTFLKVA